MAVMPKGAQFAKEVNSWKEEGIIDSYQAQAILAKYKLAKSPPKRLKVSDDDKQHEERSSKTIAVVSTLGAILVGIGIILFIASNWRAIPAFAKILLLLATTFALYFAGWKLKFDTPNYPSVGEALLFLASISVGATIFLTAQIYNVPAHESFLMLLWFLAIAPLTYALSSKPILLLSILTFASWMRSELGGYFTSDLFSIMTIFLAFGISLYGAGQLHRNFERFARFSVIYQTFGLIYILISFFFYSLESIYFVVKFEGFGSLFATVSFVIFTLLGLASMAGILISRRKTRTGFYEFLLLLLAFAGFAAITLFGAFKDSFLRTVTEYGYTRTVFPEGFGTAMFVVFALIVFAISIGAMLIGYYRGITPFVNTGIIFFILNLAHIYWNTAVRFLPKSISLIIGGVILIAGGIYLEKKRREIIGNMGGEMDE